MTRALDAGAPSPLRRILVGLDLEAEAQGPVLREAARLASALDATLILAHAVPELADRALAPVVGRAAERALEGVERGLDLGGARCERPHLVETHEPPDVALRTWAAQRQADLVLLGARARSGPSRLLFGSTAERAARTASRPVWFAHAEAPESAAPQAPRPIRHVLCAVDGSAAADAALSLAGHLARRLGARLSALCVLPRLDGPLALTLRPPIPRARAVARGFRAAVARARRAGVEAEVVCRRGAPAEAILRAAEELEVDLLVLGCAGRTGLRRLGRGNTAERVVRSAPCALLVVPAAAAPPAPDGRGPA